MTAFLWVMLVMLSVSALGKIIWVSKDEFPDRDRRTEIVDIFLTMFMIFWAANLLFIGG